MLAQGRGDEGGADDLTDAVPGRQLRLGVRDSQLRADADRHHHDPDEREAEEGGGDEQNDRGGAEDGEESAEDLETVAGGQRLDRADLGGDCRPDQGRRGGGQPRDQPRRGRRGVSEDGAGEDDEVGADDDVAAALEELAGGEDGHGSAAVGFERCVGVWGGCFRCGDVGRDRPGPGDDGEQCGHGCADEPQLTPVDEAAGGEDDGSGDEGAEADSAVGDTAVAGSAGVRGNALGRAHEDQPRDDLGDRADGALPEEIRSQGNRGQAEGGDDEAETVDAPVGFDPAAATTNVSMK